jgi:hypothetical protein
MAWNMLAGDAANGIQPLLPIRNPQLLTQLALHMDAVQLRRKVLRLLSSSSPARVVVQGGVVIAGDADEFDSYADAGMDIAPADEPRGSSLLASVFGRAKPSDSGTFASLPLDEKVSTGKVVLFCLSPASVPSLMTINRTSCRDASPKPPTKRLALTGTCSRPVGSAHPRDAAFTRGWGAVLFRWAFFVFC